MKHKQSINESILTLVDGQPAKSKYICLEELKGLSIDRSLPPIVMSSQSYTYLFHMQYTSFTNVS